MLTSTRENLAQKCLLQSGDVPSIGFGSLRYFANQMLFLEIAFKRSISTCIGQPRTPAKAGHLDSVSSHTFGKYLLCETCKLNN